MTDPTLSHRLLLVSPQPQIACARTDNGVAVLNSPALADIIRERIEQVEVHGFDFHHDDMHDECELARGAIAYVSAGVMAEIEENPVAAIDTGLSVWPWPDLFKPADYRSCLIKAAAMLWAEADRVHRAEQLIGAVRACKPDDGRKCRRCGCTQHNACFTGEGTCFWIAEDLCSACAGKHDPHT